LAISD
jgi:hypothetical protein